MAGFLLADDAVEARRNIFDQWLEQRKRDAAAAAQAAQQTAGTAAQTVGGALQATTDEVAQRARIFDDWLASRPAPAPPQTAPAAAAPTMSPPVVPPVSSPTEPPVSPDVQERRGVFEQWLRDRQQPVQDVTQPVTPAVAPAVQPAQPNATDVVPLDRQSGRVFPVQGYTGQVDYHWGAVKGGSDLFAPRGTPVVAMEPGKVLEAGSNAVGGNSVLIQGDDGLQYYYAHLDAAPSVKVGQQVTAGTFLGPVGDTGDAKGRGTHLHIGIGPDIRLGADKYGGTGGDYDAVGLLRSTLAPQDVAATASRAPATRTTAELSGGGAQGTLGDRALNILGGAADAARAFGDDAVKAVQAVLVTEGGLNNARGDNAKSAGPLQFFGEEGGRAGQLNNLATFLGTSLAGARDWVEQHPVAAVQWALGTPDNPGYLGKAILAGQRAGKAGADLATFIQANGQVSVSPERAGQNFRNLFGQGQAAVTSAVTGAGETVSRTAGDVASRAQQLADDSQRLARDSADRAQAALDLLNQTRQRISAENERYSAARRADINRTLADIMQPRQVPFGLPAESRSVLGEGPFGAFRAPSLEMPGGVQQTIERADALLRQHPELGGPSVDWTRPLGPQLGVDPLGQLQSGIPDIVEGVRSGDAGRVATGLLQVAGAVGSALPGGGGPGGQAAARATTAARAAPAVAEAVAPAAAETGRALELAPRLAEPGGFVAPTVEPVTTPTTRMYHGTGAEFERPAGAHFNEEGLFGPGYYLTNDARIASNYATTRAPVQAQAFDQLQGWLADARARGNPEEIAYRQSQIDNLLAAGEPGANVRALDVPQNLRLLDMEAPITATDIRRIGNAMGDADGRYFIDELTQRPFGETGEDVYSWLTEWGWPKSRINQVLADAGYDGIQYAGGKRIPMLGATGQPIEHTAVVVFPASLNKVRNAISGTQGGQASAAYAMRLGSTGLGAATGYATAPEDATQEERLKRAAIGGAAGLAAPSVVSLAARDPRFALRLSGAAGGLVSQEATMTEEEKRNPFVRVSRDLSGLLLGSAAPALAESGIRGVAATVRGRVPDLNDLAQIRQTLGARQMNLPGTAGQPMTPGELISAVGKQNLLAGIKQHVTNIGSQMVELARTPVRAALAGQGDQALLAMRAGINGIPDALNEFARTWTSGISSTAQPGQRTQAWLPVFRFLGATDDFFRVLGAHMGMATEAQRLVNEAGAKTPQAIRQVLAQNEQRIFQAGQREGAASVFQTMGMQGAQDTMTRFGRWKNEWLGAVAQSPAWQDRLSAYGKQGLALLVDALVPFAGMPGRLFDIGIGRLPVIGETRRFAELAMAAKRGDSAAAQRALGELGMQSVLSSVILTQTLAGNIRGPDDPDHPNSALIGGNWVDYSGWGAFQLPLAMPAAAMEEWRKTGNRLGAGDREYLGAVMNAWGKTLVNSYYLNGLFDFLTAVGEGRLSDAVAKTLTSYTDRSIPSGFNQVEQMIDQNVREVSKQFPQSIVDRWKSRVPYLAQTLPAQVEPTTGAERARERQGPLGTLLGVETYQQSPIEQEIYRLNRLGYALRPPRDYPQTLSVGGAQIRLSPQEQHALAQGRGEYIDRVLGARMQSSYWRTLTDDQRARLIARALDQASAHNVVTWRRMTPVNEQRDRIARGERVVGRLEEQGAFGGFTAPGAA